MGKLFFPFLSWQTTERPLFQGKSASTNFVADCSHNDKNALEENVTVFV